MVLSEMFVRKGMFDLTLALGTVWPVEEWTWNEGRNKMLNQEERQEQKNLPNLEEYKKILIEQQKNKQPETMLVEFLFKNAK